MTFPTSVEFDKPHCNVQHLAQASCIAKLVEHCNRYTFVEEAHSSCIGMT